MRIIDTFQPQVPSPIDDRSRVSTLTDLDTLRRSTRSYPGLITYCDETDTLYHLSPDKSEWIPFSFSIKSKKFTGTTDSIGFLRTDFPILFGETVTKNVPIDKVVTSTVTKKVKTSIHVQDEDVPVEFSFDVEESKVAKDPEFITFTPVPAYNNSFGVVFQGEGELLINSSVSCTLYYIE